MTLFLRIVAKQTSENITHSDLKRMIHSCFLRQDHKHCMSHCLTILASAHSDQKTEQKSLFQQIWNSYCRGGTSAKFEQTSICRFRRYQEVQTGEQADEPKSWTLARTARDQVTFPYPEQLDNLHPKRLYLVLGLTPREGSTPKCAKEKYSLFRDATICYTTNLV